MKIAMANDHAGTKLKNEIKAYLESEGHEVKDFGTYDEESCDLSAFIGPAIAMEIVKTWMHTDPLTAEKYRRRVKKVQEIDAKHCVAVK